MTVPADRKPTYTTWRGMQERCRNPKHRSYSEYGGAGIRIYFDWVGRGGFAAFVRDVGLRPEGHELDRIDPRGHYEPGNVRWLKRAANRSRARAGAGRYDEVHEGRTLREWAEHLGVRYTTLLRRLQRGSKNPFRRART